MTGSTPSSRQSVLPTHFAPAEREGPQELLRERAQLDRNPLVRALLDSGSGHLMVLNARRQIVAAGSNLPKGASREAIETMIGVRPGEGLGCWRATEGPGGCGTGPHCARCGAVQVIMEALERRGRSSTQECRLLVTKCRDFEALEFRVNATYFEVEGEGFVLFAMTDISHEKRRHNLERVFFHDVLNLAGGVEGLLELMLPEATEEQRSLIQMANSNMQDLREEISVQRDLLAAEQNELKVSLTTIHSLTLLAQISQLYQAHLACVGRVIAVAPTAGAFEFRSDLVLLRRVLGNLIKNAAEASGEGQTVQVDCLSNGGYAVFTVHNCTVMSETTRLQVFQRSFSTKGADRGLGTYSVKLLTERYLKGRVRFESREPHGTTFTLEVPLNT